MFKVYQALRSTRFFENTIVIFTSGHCDLLGSHKYMHQKWYQTYEEALRVPLIISSPALPPKDVVVTVAEGVLDTPGEQTVDATKRGKFAVESEEFEMYNVSLDPLEVDNLYNNPQHTVTQLLLVELLDEQRRQKRVRDINGDVPG